MRFAAKTSPSRGLRRKKHMNGVNGGMSFYISGTGSAIPRRRVTNDELATMVDTSDEWISTRTGIKERRVMTDETLLSLSAEAGRRALEDAGVLPEEIDLLICTTLQGDYISPSLCCTVAGELGITSCGSMFDMNMACCGFIYALDAADAYFRAGKAKKALVISAEAMSRLIDWTDRSTCVLFGDGAGAAVLEAGDGLEDIRLTVTPDIQKLFVDIRGDASPFEKMPERTAMTMNGQEIYIFAVSAIIAEINGILERAALSPDDIGHYVLHQANLRIIESARRKLRQPTEKMPTSIARYGNTSSASVPILLDELNRSGALKQGERIVMCAFGAGLTTGTCLIRWNKAAAVPDGR